MKALFYQLKTEVEKYDLKENSIETLFIGGGTPSTVSADLYKEIFDFLHFYLEDGAEITSEVNPNSASLEWLEGMKKLGVNRLSFGVQSFNDKKLKFLNRAHTSKIAIDAINNASSIEFKNISLDIIYNVEGDTLELIKNDLEIAFTLPINHISAYSLTIEEDTKFFNTPKVSVENEEITNFLFSSIIKNGFDQYEISNFGSYNSKHNMGYWRYKNYLGIGAGAVGFFENKRFYTQKGIEEYIENPNILEIEYLNSDEIKSEKVLLGLRSKIGFDINILNVNELKNVNILVEEQKLSKNGDRVYNTEYLLSDELSLFILD